jgi:pimeloyl-ACP methyl ester carboxylesterase
LTVAVPRELRIDIPHGHLAARCWGDPALPPLLALHGWLDNAGSFDALAPLLAHRWRVVALDLRGHGHSSHLPPGAWIHYVDYLDDLVAAFAHFGWERADLLGHSLGGTLACLFAAALPERTGRLLLVEALGPLSTPPPETLAQFRRGLAERAAFARRRPLRVFPDLDAAVAVRVAAGELTAAAARPIVERGTRAVAGGYVWSSDPRLTLASLQRYTEDQVRAMLAGIRAPTRLVLAEPPAPYLAPASMAERMDCVADLAHRRLRGHHHLHLESPREVAAFLLGG